MERKVEAINRFQIGYFGACLSPLSKKNALVWHVGWGGKSIQEMKLDKFRCFVIVATEHVLCWQNMLSDIGIPSKSIKSCQRNVKWWWKGLEFKLIAVVKDLLTLTNLMRESDLADHSRNERAFTWQLHPWNSQRGWHFGRSYSHPNPSPCWVSFWGFTVKSHPRKRQSNL